MKIWLNRLQENRLLANHLMKTGAGLALDPGLNMAQSRGKGLDLGPDQSQGRIFLTVQGQIARQVNPDKHLWVCASHHVMAAIHVPLSLW